MAHIHPMKFVHVVYRTRRFEQMVRWYQIVFDAKVQYQSPALAFLTYDGEHHRFAFANLDILKPETTERDRRGLIGVDHVAYTYASLKDLLENYAHLKAQGVKPYWCIHHGMTVSLYYADPEGNQMEFQVDCFGSSEEANAFMAGPHFAANPIGVEYDPDDWLARLRAGTAPSEFLMRQTHEPVSPIRGSFAN
jgi:catechol-2,3-dioxygenase